MELTCIKFSSFQQDQQQQQQQQQTSLIQSNSHPNIVEDCLENQEPSTSESVTSTSPAIVFDNLENGYQSQPNRSEKIHEIDQERIVRFVYFGQAVLIIIVALACVAFTILEPKMIIENITSTKMNQPV
ncbi:unnamed protein product [Onchocerca ochengi]|uniref:Uncharacterized protein n=1 Tax=Onchocerca ochengi TaxID=42157 RepID=A0A182EBF7_ONCOC|nr:unnamed protein product [Onchocerca ochengi]